MIKTKKKQVLGRPFKDGIKRERTSLTLNPSRLRWLKTKANALSLSVSECLNKMIEEAQNHQAIEQFCRIHHVKKLALFGSVLGKRFGSLSDVDILVEFIPGHEPSYFKLITLEEKLSPMFGNRKIDLRTPAELSRYFRDQILTQAKTLYAA